MEARFNFVAALTTLPFAGVHIPLLLLGDQVSVLSVLLGIAALLILGVGVRLLMGVILRAAVDSVLAVGILDQIFDASNNNGVLVDFVLDGVDAGNMRQLAAVVLAVQVAESGGQRVLCLNLAGPNHQTARQFAQVFCLIDFGCMISFVFCYVRQGRVARPHMRLWWNWEYLRDWRSALITRSWELRAQSSKISGL